MHLHDMINDYDFRSYAEMIKVEDFADRDSLETAPYTWKELRALSFTTVEQFETDNDGNCIPEDQCIERVVYGRGGKIIETSSWVPSFVHPYWQQLEV